MIKDFEVVRAQLRELSEVINSYKSEAVQLRLVDLIFGAPNAQPAGAAAEAPPANGQTQPPSKKRKKVKASVGAGGVSTTVERSSRSTSRPGARSTLASLLDEGFFKQPRTIGGLVEHCDSNRASKFKQSDFSGTLARYVREKKLTRAKNSDGQYEYTQP